MGPQVDFGGPIDEVDVDRRPGPGEVWAAPVCRPDFGVLPATIGRSDAMAELSGRVRRVADSSATVLIEGETGTGKELVALAIHDLSGRRGRPFVAVNIGALPESLIESELFGHERGAFSGADHPMPGWFERAQGGTLFLDEVGEMHPRSQVDLLRVLEQREVRRLGGGRSIPLDVRLVAATNRDLEALVAEGRLRADVYYRLNVVRVRVPPLRERRDDVPLLIPHFLEQAGRHHRRDPKPLSVEAIRALTDYDWPGNVRQLRNALEQIVLTAAGPIIQVDDLPREIRTAMARPPATTLDDVVREAEEAAIRAALDRCDNHRGRAAQRLGICVRTLHYKMSRLGLT